MSLTVLNMTATLVSRQLHGDFGTGGGTVQRVQIKIETVRPDGVKWWLVEEWPMGTELVAAVDKMLTRAQGRLQTETSNV
jgi:hypothetical protein